MNESLYENIDLSNIKEALIKSANVGFLIYDDSHIVFANDYACKLSEYTRQELSNMNVLDLIHESIRERFERLVKHRAKGGVSGIRFYGNIMCKTKSGKSILLNLTTGGLRYNSKPMGFVLISNVTSERELKVFYSVLKDINHMIVESTSRVELYERVCRTFVEKHKMKLAWIGEINNGNIDVIYAYGHKGYVDEIKYENLIDHDVAGLASKSGDIEIIKYIGEDDRFNKKIREKMVKYELFSACSIPLEGKDGYKSVLNIYSEPYYFIDDVHEILDEIQLDLSFSLRRIEDIQKRISFYEAVKLSDWWFLITDEKGKILFVNDSVCKMSGYPEKELIGQNPRIFKSGLHDEHFYSRLWDDLLNNKIVDVVVANRRKNGTIFHIQDKIIPVTLPGNIRRFIAIGRDITDEIKLSDEAYRLKHQDALTGLLNLNGFVSTVDMRIKDAEIGSMALIDILNFSYINRVYGFEMGDKLLRAIAKRLKDEFPLVDCVARIGSDDFAIFVDSKHIRSDIAAIPAKLSEIFQEPFVVNQKEIPISINASIVLYPTDANNVKELMEKASITLNKSKKDGKSSISFYNPSADKNVQRFILAERLVRDAVKESLFVLHYQPYYSSWDTQVSGFEALVRIKKDNGELVYPNAFIDYLESSKFLRYFEKWLVREVGENILEWKLPISINISAVSFKDKEFIGEIIDACEYLEGNLSIEITERTLMESIKDSREIIEKIKSVKHPPKISIDDFGTGYASLSMLQEFPIDVVKIDMSFVRNIYNNRRNIAIVQTIIQLAKALGVKTIAEGVETEEEYKTLRTMGADYIQGYYFAKPMDEKDIINYIKS